MTATPDLADLLAAGLGDPGTASMPSWQPPTPDQLTGLPNLEAIALIGCGGMGAVYRARQTHLDRIVALKVLPPERGRDPAFVQRFNREARAMARLRHPHIVTLYDFGCTEDWLYLVMELIEGASLRDVMRTGNLGAGESLRLVSQLCDALAHAHAAGVVHRDLKPDNILIDGQGQAFITDFGIAKLSDESLGTELTGSGSMLGTAHYMAPEQIAGSAQVDHRADLYALGVITYELLTGHLPLGRFAEPSKTSGLDAKIDDVVMKSLERDPAKRWQSATELRQAMVGMDDAARARPQDRSKSETPTSDNIEVGPIHIDEECVRIGNWIRVDRHGTHTGKRHWKQAHWTSAPVTTNEKTHNRLYHAGMTQVLCGTVLGVGLWLSTHHGTTGTWETQLALVMTLLIVASGISLLCHCLLPLALVGGIGLFGILPWAWTLHWFWFIVVLIGVLSVWGKIRSFHKLVAHYQAPTPWTRWAWGLPLILVACTLAIWIASRYVLAPDHMP